MTNDSIVGYVRVRSARHILSKYLISGISLFFIIAFFMNTTIRFVSYYMKFNRNELSILCTGCSILKFILLGLMPSIIISTTISLRTDTSASLFPHNVNYATLIHTVGLMSRLATQFSKRKEDNCRNKLTTN